MNNEFPIPLASDTSSGRYKEEYPGIGECEVVETVCSNQCETMCGIKAYVKDGKIKRVYGNEANPISRGGLCTKGQFMGLYPYSPYRVKFPMITQKDGSKKRSTWSEALDFIADDLKNVREKYGPGALAYFGSGRTDQQERWVGAMFMELFGSPNVTGTGPLCGENNGVGAHFVFGSTFGLGRQTQGCEDWVNSKCIFICGKNVMETEPTTGQWLIEAKERGAKLIVMDPRYNKTASKADLYIQHRPGTDVAVFNSMMHVIIDEDLYDHDFISNWCYGWEEFKEFILKYYSPEDMESVTWVPVEKIRKAARMFATRTPSTIVSNHGTAQQYQGTNNGRCTAMLTAIVGNMGKPGGGWTVMHQTRGGYPTGLPNDVKPKDGVTKDEKFLLNGFWGRTMGMRYKGNQYCSPHPYGTSLADWWDFVHEGKIKALIWNGNQACNQPNSYYVRECLKKLDTSVHLGLWANGTGKLSNVVLPITYGFEFDGTTHHANERRLEWHRKVIDPLWEQRPGRDFWIALAKRFGWDLTKYLGNTPESVHDWFVKAWPLSYGQTAKFCKENVGRGWWPHMKGDDLPMYYMYLEDQDYPTTDTRFPTPQKKIMLVSEELEELGYDRIPVQHDPTESVLRTPKVAEEYPLTLTTGHIVETYHEQGRYLPWGADLQPHQFVNIHTETAKELGIEDGKMVYIESRRAIVKAKARVNYAVHPRVVWMPEGWDEEQPFFPYAPTDLLLPSETDPFYGQAQYKGSGLVKVYRADDEDPLSGVGPKKEALKGPQVKLKLYTGWYAKPFTDIEKEQCKNLMEEDLQIVKGA